MKRYKLGDKLEAFLINKEEEDEATRLMEEDNTKVLRRSKVCAALFERSGSPEDNDDKTLAIDAKPGNKKLEL